MVIWSDKFDPTPLWDELQKAVDNLEKCLRRLNCTYDGLAEPESKLLRAIWAYREQKAK